MKISLYFSPDAFSVDMKNLMGRNVAGNTFFHALLEHTEIDLLNLIVGNPSHLKHAQNIKETLSANMNVDILSPANLSGISHSGLLFLPGPNIGELCLQRSFVGHTNWSICGITHTTSSARIMDALGNLLIAPMQNWDSVICTSPAVRSHVLAILDAKKNYLNERFGIQKVPNINLPVIPLGIDTRRFEPLSKNTTTARSTLKITDDEIVISFVGRLSWHAKAHPIPMYLAVSEVAKITGKKIVLVECGWYANDSIENVYKNTQSIFSESFRFLHIDGRDPTSVENVYAASDIFVSLSDNIQETFGITPIEAMSAGIPVVVSDWDGYRHSVRDGIDGFRIRTLVPEMAKQQDLIYRYEMKLDTYDYYCGHTSMSNIIDVGQLIHRLTELVQNSDLRVEMGQHGQVRARDHYDWSIIIREYIQHWESLEVDRKSNDDLALAAPSIWPERLDPMIAFKEYPTERLKLNDILEHGAASGSNLEKILRDHMITYAKQVIMPATATIRILSGFSDKFKANELAEALAPGNVPLGMRLVASLVKFDVVRISRGVP